MARVPRDGVSPGTVKQSAQLCSAWVGQRINRVVEVWGLSIAITPDPGPSTAR